MLIELIAASVIAAAISANKAKEKTKAKLRSEHDANNFYGKSIAAIQTRSQQLKEISGDLIRPLSSKEQNIEIHLVVATATLGIAGFGALLHSPIILLGLPGILFSGKSYFTDAYETIVTEKKVGSAALDSVFVASCVVNGYFFSAALCNFFVWVGRKLLVKTEDLSRAALENIFGELPSQVWRAEKGIDAEGWISNSAEKEVALESIIAGDTIVVTAGGVIPIDGIVLDGYATIDQRMLTGESQPAEKEIGDQVLASTSVLFGKIYIRVEKAGNDTVVSKIGEILEQTVNLKTSFQSRGESIADKSAAPLLGLGAVALPFIGANGAIAVVNSNFGVNMRFVAPFATLAFLTMASRQGVLVKDGRVFELLKSVDTIVFDKTGTLTTQEPHVAAIHTFGTLSEDQLLRIAASVEQRQSHPIARAIQQEAKDRGLELFEKSDTHYEVGYGLQVKMNDQTILLGSDRFMKLKKIKLTQGIRKILKKSQAQGHSSTLVAIDHEIAGVIELHATIRHGAKDVMQFFRRSGMHLHIISGDQEPPTKQLAEDLGIDHYHANTLPEHKAKIIEQLQQQGHSVCFVGDGINDSIALKQANVSVSLRGASTHAIDTAQAILMDGNLAHLESMFELAKDYENNIRRSFLMTVVPGAINLYCALFLSSGVIFSVILDKVGGFSGVVNGIAPLLKKRD